MQIPGTVVVRLEGELDYGRRAEMERQLFAHLDSSALDVDMSGVTFIDSTAVSALIKALKAYRARNARMTIVDPSKPVEKILEITGLQRIFAIERH